MDASRSRPVVLQSEHQHHAGFTPETGICLYLSDGSVRTLLGQQEAGDYDRHDGRSGDDEGAPCVDGLRVHGGILGATSGMAELIPARTPPAHLRGACRARRADRCP